MSSVTARSKPASDRPPKSEKRASDPGELLPADDIVDAAHRAKLDAGIRRGLADVTAGRFITEKEFLRELDE